MKVLFIIGAVAVAFTLFVVLVWYFADPPEDPQPEPEVHHVASGRPPWEPAPFPGPEPVLDYQPCEPFRWWEDDEAVDRANGVT